MATAALEVLLPRRSRRRSDPATCLDLGDLGPIASEIEKASKQIEDSEVHGVPMLCT